VCRRGSGRPAAGWASVRRVYGPDPSTITWVVLTTGNRPEALQQAVSSLGPTGSVAIVANGFELAGAAVRVDHNVGIPAGRHMGVHATEADIVGFLDDDAVASEGVSERVVAAFESDPTIGAVALRLVDEDGNTARRHVPRFGGRDPERGGDVALFLGGACAMRREAYEDAGGYWGELFYGHEELEFAWRLIDHGWRIVYLPEATVFHPRTEIGRHADGWRMTGRNRVMIARRTLPWPIAFVHVTGWLVLGTLRASGRANRVAYLNGWRSGWTQPVDRRPIRWRTVWRLGRLGRPPIL
jgi:GT2 family glycosyltransferase